MLSVVFEVRMEPSIINAYEQIDVACGPTDFPVVIAQLGELPQSWPEIHVPNWQCYCPYRIR